MTENQISEEGYLRMIGKIIVDLEAHNDCVGATLNHFEELYEEGLLSETFEPRFIRLMRILEKWGNIETTRQEFNAIVKGVEIEE